MDLLCCGFATLRPMVRLLFPAIIAFIAWSLGPCIVYLMDNSPVISFLWQHRPILPDICRGASLFLGGIWSYRGKTTIMGRKTGVYKNRCKYRLVPALFHGCEYLTKDSSAGMR